MAESTDPISLDANDTSQGQKPPKFPSPQADEVNDFPASSNDTKRSQDCLEYADQMKAEGNDHFRAGRWEEALASYRVGLGRLPKRKMKEAPKRRTRDDDPTFDIEQEHDTVFGKESSKAQGKKPEESPMSEESAEPEAIAEEDPYAQPRAVLNANIAACFMKLVRVRPLQADPLSNRALE